MRRNNAAGWGGPFGLILTLILLVGLVAAPVGQAQDAATPVAVDSTSETHPNNDGEQPPPSDPPADPIEPNSDSVTPLGNAGSVAAGGSHAFVLVYTVTTVRSATAIHAELRDAAGQIAAGWTLTINGVTGDGQVDLLDGAIEPSLLSLDVTVTTPLAATAGESVELYLRSTVSTPSGMTETGLNGLIPLAAVAVAAPAPDGSEQTDDDVPPADGTPEPATPTAESPESSPPPPAPPDSPVPATPIDIAAELLLQDRAAETTVDLDNTGSATVDYIYVITADRLSTTIHAAMVDIAGEPSPGWTVSLNGAGPDLLDTGHGLAGDSFPVTVTVTRDPAARSAETARLQFTVTIVLPGTPPPVAAADMFAIALVDESTEPSGEDQSATLDGPLVRLPDDGEFTASSTVDSGQLTCNPANNFGPNDDGAVPGQILHYACTIPVGIVVATLSGSVSLPIGAADGWQFRVIYTVQIAGLSTAIDSGWTTTTQSLGGLSLLSGSMTIHVDLRAPSVSLTPSAGIGDSQATLVISASTTPGCGLSLVCSGSATINAYAAMTASSSGGGQLLGLISGVAGLTPGQALFGIDCGAIPNNYTVAPGVRVAVNCQFRSLAALATLLGLATVSSNLTLTSTNSGWDFALAPGQNAEFSESLDNSISLNLGNVINAGLFNNGWFTVFFMPTGYCGTVPGNLLDSMIIEASYNLTLVGGLLTAPLSNGYAVVPVRVQGDGDLPASAPAVTANDLNFGTFTYNGSTYTGGATPALGVALSPPASGCADPNWHVTAQYSAFTGYVDAGHTTELSPAMSIPVSALAYSGAPTGGSATVIPSTPDPTGGADVIVTGTSALAGPQTVTYTLSLAPPNTQRVGFYQGTVTVTTHAGVP